MINKLRAPFFGESRESRENLIARNFARRLSQALDSRRTQQVFILHDVTARYLDLRFGYIVRYVNAEESFADEKS